MAHKHRGELEVESGLGLPRRTTAERVAYVPPSDGYAVFDTDLKQVAAWDATNTVWILLANAASLTDKIDTLDGVAKNTLSLIDTDDVAVMALTGNSVASTASILASVATLTVGTADTSFAIGETFTTTTKPILGVDGTDAASLITKAYVDNLASQFRQNFVVADWSTTNSISTLVYSAATHGLTFGTDDVLEVDTYAISGGILTEVTIDLSINNVTGDVTLTTRGQPFDGRILISR
jgi:hypothetical protein